MSECKKSVVVEIDSIEEIYPDGYRRILRGFKGIMCTSKGYEDMFDIEGW